MTAHDGLVVGRIVRVTTPPDSALPWLWTISTGERHDFGRDATRETAMQALARNWRKASLGVGPVFIAKTWPGGVSADIARLHGKRHHHAQLIRDL
jgi:hypothetical protein